jgi:hypothetical protein
MRRLVQDKAARSVHLDGRAEQPIERLAAGILVPGLAQ